MHARLQTDSNLTVQDEVGALMRREQAGLLHSTRNEATKS